jgi:hypothetical protein
MQWGATLTGTPCRPNADICYVWVHSNHNLGNFLNRRRGVPCDGGVFCRTLAPWVLRAMRLVTTPAMVSH